MTRGPEEVPASDRTFNLSNRRLELLKVLRREQGLASGRQERISRRPPAGAALAGRPAELPLSFSQERLWFLDQLEPGSAVYNVPTQVRLRGILDPALLAAVFQEIVRRHEVLRTTFARAGDRPVQVIAAASRVDVPLVDLTGLPERRRREESQALTTAAARRPFDLVRGPLLRVLLLRLASGGDRKSVV